MRGLSALSPDKRHHHTEFGAVRIIGIRKGLHVGSRPNRDLMPSYRQTRVESIVRRAPVFARADETLRSVAHTMWVENVGALVVGDERNPVGIISERDIVSRIGQGEDPDSLAAGQVMSKSLIAARTGDTLDDAAYEMLEGDIRHLPLMDLEDQVVAMVSVRDLLRPLLSDGPEVWNSDRDR